MRRALRRFGIWIGRRFLVIRRYKRRLEKLEHSLSLAEMERLSLQRQLDVAIETIQAFGLHNRAIGAEAKVYTAHLTAATKP